MNWMTFVKKTKQDYALNRHCSRLNLSPKLGPFISTCRLMAYNEFNISFVNSIK